MSKRREHGDGGIDERGPGSFRLRYRVGGKRFSVTFKVAVPRPRSNYGGSSVVATQANTWPPIA